MGPIEAVTFDVSTTLLFDPNRHFRTARRRALKRWLQHHEVRLEKEGFRSLASSAARVWVESREAGVRDVGARTSDYIVASLQIRVTDRERSELQRLVEDLNREPRYLSAEGALGALRYLKGRGVGVGIVSNRSSNPAWLVMRQLEAAGLAQFFDPAAIAWSDRVGWRKPDPRLFLYSLGALGASPSRAAHVGNSKLKDVRGARALGMMTVRYAGIRDERGDGPEADVVIRRYDELAEVLGLAGTAAERTVARAERESQS